MRLALALLSAAPALAASIPIQAAAAVQPDFSRVRTAAAARKLVAGRELVRMHLFPTELGGRDDHLNASYTTPEAAQARLRLIGTITRMLEEGGIDQMQVKPDYKGDSIVPSRIRIKCWHSAQPGVFEVAIDVW